MMVFYDSEGDIFIVERIPAYEEQIMRTVGDGILVRENPNTGAIESLEIWNFARRAGSESGLDLPVEVQFMLPSSHKRLAV